MPKLATTRRHVGVVHYAVSAETHQTTDVRVQQAHVNVVFERLEVLDALTEARGALADQVLVDVLA